MAINTTITTLPTPPTSADSATFSTRADNFLAALPTLQSQLVNYASEANQTALDLNAAQVAANAAANFRGTWSSATAYTVGQSVLFSGFVYTALTNNTNQQPPNATHWVLLADTIFANLLARQQAIALSF